MHRLILPAALAAILLCPAPAMSETVTGRRIAVEFAFDASTPEMTAAERWGAKTFAKAEAAGRPVRVGVARSDSTTMMSLESVAVCTRAQGCPLLVFRDLAKPPVLDTMAYQNVILDYREKETFLIMRVWDKVTECRLSGLARARCKDISKTR